MDNYEFTIKNGFLLAYEGSGINVVIPETVRYVDWRAFGSCTNLKNLVIEGDLSRVANWDKDAFEGCPKSRADS